MATAKDVNKFLRFMWELGGAYVVNDESYVCANRSTGPEKVPIPDGNGQPKYLAIFDSKQTNTDVVVCNPFLSGIDESAEIDVFYMTRSMVPAVLLGKIMKNMLVAAIAAKSHSSAAVAEKPSKKKAGKVRKTAEDEVIEAQVISDTDGLDASAVSLLAPLVSQPGLSTDLLKDLEKITSNPGKFLLLNYVRKRNYSTTVNCGLFESSFRDIHKSVSDRNWNILKDLAARILGTDDPKEKFRHTGQILGCAHLDGYTRCMYDILTAMSPYFVFENVITAAIDLETLKDHIDNMEEYFDVAKHFMTALNTSATTTPSVAPAPTAATPWSTSPVTQTVNTMSPTDQFLNSVKTIGNNGMPQAPQLQPVIPGPGMIQAPTLGMNPGMVPGMAAPNTTGMLGTVAATPDNPFGDPRKVTLMPNAIFGGPMQQGMINPGVIGVNHGMIQAGYTNPAVVSPGGVGITCGGSLVAEYNL